MLEIVVSKKFLKFYRRFWDFTFQFIDFETRIHGFCVKSEISDFRLLKTFFVIFYFVALQK